MHVGYALHSLYRPPQYTSGFWRQVRVADQMLPRGLHVDWMKAYEALNN